MGLQGRRSLTPRVSPSRAPVLSFAHYFQAPATQALKGVTSGKKNVEDNENFKLLCDFSIQIDKKLDQNRPDIVSVDKQNKNCFMYH